MAKILLINGTPSVAKNLSASTSHRTFVARHGRPDPADVGELGDPAGYHLAIHMCINGIQGEVRNTGNSTPVPIVDKKFTDRFLANGGFSVFFVDYFNHEIPQHPSAFRLSEAPPGSADLTSSITGTSLDGFVSKFKESFGRYFLKPVEKTKGKVLIASSGKSPVMFLDTNNSLILPTPLDANVIPEMVTYLIEHVMGDFVPGLSPDSVRSSKLAHLRQAIAELSIKHEEEMSDLKAKLESERRFLSQLSRLNNLDGKPLLNAVTEILEENFGFTLIDLGPLGEINGAAMLLLPSGIALFASQAHTLQTLARDIQSTLQDVAKLRDRNIEISSVGLLYRLDGDHDADNVGEIRGMLNDIAQTTGLTLVSVEDLERLVSGRREGQVNTNDLVAYFHSGFDDAQGIMGSMAA